jgi:hypothetical protein
MTASPGMGRFTPWEYGENAAPNGVNRVPAKGRFPAW